jgi:hypothetical protein
MGILDVAAAHGRAVDVVEHMCRQWVLHLHVDIVELTAMPDQMQEVTSNQDCSIASSTCPCDCTSFLMLNSSTELHSA